MAKPQIVSEWRLVLRSWSFQSLAIIAALPTIMAQLPPEAAAYLNAHFHLVVSAIAVIGVVLRFTKQFDRPTVAGGNDATVDPTQEDTMAAANTISQILEEAPDFIKLIEDGVAVFTDVKAKGVLAGFADVQKFEPDIARVYADIKALGVSQAIAAGTVVAPPAAPPYAPLTALSGAPITPGVTS